MPMAMDRLDDLMEEHTIAEEYFTEPDDEGRMFDKRRDETDPNHEDWVKLNTIREFYMGYYVDADCGPQSWSGNARSLR